MSTFGGIVLCGGRSSRMGQAKAWLPFDGERMLPRIVRIVRRAVEPVVVVAAPRQDLPELHADVTVVRDAVEGGGPLHGLLAGLESLQGRVEGVYLSSCDVPFLRSAFVMSMVSALAESESSAVTVPRVGDRIHPLAAAYRSSILPAVRQYIADGRSSLIGLLECLATRVVEAHELIDVDPELESLWNLNTPEEYEEALRRLTS